MLKINIFETYDASDSVPITGYQSWIRSSLQRTALYL